MKNKVLVTYITSTVLAVVALANSFSPQVSYLVMQKDRSCIGSIQNSAIKDITLEGNWPSFINYTEDIDNTTAIGLQVTFEDSDGTVHDEYENILNSSVCSILDRAIDDPTSADARFLIPEALGLYGMRCPIEAGLRSISPYRFPTLIYMAPMGEGQRTMKISLFQRNNQTAIKENILKISAFLEMRYWPLRVIPNAIYTLTITETVRSAGNISVIEMYTLIFTILGSFIIAK